MEENHTRFNMDKDRIAILIGYRDRPTELYGLLQSLRTQTNKNWDIFILDDNSGTPIEVYHFLNMIVMRMKLEGNKFFYEKTPFNYGVSRMRQYLVDKALQEGYNLTLRLDDDILLEPDYIERLIKVMEQGYDIASGVTISFGPQLKRDPIHLKGIINRVILDKDGNFIMNGDDCGNSYTYDLTLPTHHFRSCALMKKEVHNKVSYYPTKLTRHGFREEQIFSFKALMEGFKIGVDTGAVNFHLMTPSGGERFPEQGQMIPFNQQILEEFTRENKEKLSPSFPVEPKLSELALKKENNLLLK